MELEQMLAKAVEAAMAKQAEQASSEQEVTAKANKVDEQIAALTAAVASLTDTVSKALTAREEGLGRKGTVTESATTLESDPIAHLTRKAEAGQEFDATEKAVAGALFLAAVKRGMTNSDKE